MTVAAPLGPPAIAVRGGAIARSVARSSVRCLRDNPIAIIVVLVSTAVFSFRSLYSFAAYRTNAYDLGIFGQGIKGYAEGRGPISELKGAGYSLLGDHFSPIDALLGPVYLVFPSITTLLVAQAFLIALGAPPLVAWARRELGSWAAVAVGLIFVTSFGVASAVGFDFHEVAWAVPMLSVSLSALAQRRYRLAAAAAVPLVLVKEDLGMTVAAIGAVLVIRKQRLLGSSLSVFGVLATALEVKVLLPLANPSGQYDYAGQASGFSLSAFWHESPDIVHLKITTLVLTFSVGLFLATRSTLVLVVVPTLLWRFAGSNYAYWTTGYQYSLVLMPVVMAAVVEVLIRMRRRDETARGFVRWALIGSLILNIVLGISFPIGSMLRASFWNVESRVAAQREAVDLIPTGATVAATNYLLPHLVDRSTVSLFTNASLGSRPQWIASDMTNTWPDSPDERRAHVQEAEQKGYVEVFHRDDVIVLRDGRP